MIVVDSSAMLAILLGEPEKQSFYDKLAEDDRCVMSAVNAHESAIVLRVRQNAEAVEAFWALIADLGIEIVAFDDAQVKAAAKAFDRFGKGIDPRARLNLCDCAAYALAKTFGSPLLFKGDDFTQTDIAAA